MSRVLAIVRILSAKAHILLVGFGLAELKSFHKIRHNICDIGRLLFQGFSSKRQPSHPVLVGFRAAELAVTSQAWTHYLADNGPSLLQCTSSKRCSSHPVLVEFEKLNWSRFTRLTQYLLDIGPPSSNDAVQNAFSHILFSRVRLGRNDVTSEISLNSLQLLA